MINATTNSESMSRVERAKHRGKETATVLLEADNMSIRTAPDGSCVIELFRYDGNTAVEGYRIHFCAEDRARLRGKV